MTESLTKIHIDLTGKAEIDGEAMWAHPLGDDLYEVRNVPFHAYDLNWLDVVRAVQESPDQKPSIREVVRRSGHRTVWITFAEDIPRERRLELAKELNEWKGYFENADGRYFAVDIEPDGDYQRIVTEIESWRVTGILARYRLGALSTDVRDA
jgi:hypothetical protein